MLNVRFGRVWQSGSLLLATLLVSSTAFAQFENATVSGQVSDPSGLSVQGAQVALVDIDRGTSIGVTTNGSGLYRFASVHPGRYRMEIRAAGFQVINVTGLTVNVQDHLEQNFRLSVGSLSESVTVDGQGSLVDTETGTVSTVVDRNFTDNLPMNGRSFQTLIQLTPGTVLTTSNPSDSGQFSVNGQRANANYFMLDGVSANIGITASANAGMNGAAGSLPSFSVQGGTNSLVSVDAMQEFRIQTSTYAPEYGRTPGAQISIITRSGTNQFHGTAFDYLRNDVLDANDWFANHAGSPKPEERQNDFGGTFNGPIVANRTFFFFSYEGMRLRQPVFSQTTVPDASARASAIPAMQPFLNAYPIENGPEVLVSGNPTGTGQFNASYSAKSTLDAASLRLDHRISDKVSVFARYSYSPSELVQRPSGQALNELQTSRIVTQTATAGTTWLINNWAADDLRFNYSRTAASGSDRLDNFGGATPLPAASQPFPSPFGLGDSLLTFDIFGDASSGGLLGGGYEEGKIAENVQHQINIVDNLSLQRGSHGLKVGVDFRRLSPFSNPANYSQTAFFFGISSAENGQALETLENSGRASALIFKNLGFFAQDTWRMNPRVTLTYGMRWDVDFAPGSSNGLHLLAVQNFNNLSALSLAPDGTPIFSTRYGNFAPRIGAAISLRRNPNWTTVLRGGFGVFYDLATQEVGEFTAPVTYPFGATAFQFGSIPYPLNSTTAAPPQIMRSSIGELLAIDPRLNLPYTLQWNTALEQVIGGKQSITASYIGAAGRRLIQTDDVGSPGNPAFGSAILVGNHATSDYDALQVQFQRNMSHGLQALASYTWSHSLDEASAGSTGALGNIFSPDLGASQNRGASDFDVRNALSVGFSYDLPKPHFSAPANAVLGGWSLESIVQARSATPVSVTYGLFSYFIGPNPVLIRPDVMPGVPLYLYGSSYPGGKIINNTPGAVASGCPDGSVSIGPFCPPPVNSSGSPTRQGNLPRNALRGFGAAQWDFAVHRAFPIRENLRLEFRAEFFNVLNHPNFGNPSGDLTNPFFGQSINTLGQSLDNFNQGGGSFSPLYQLGGPRSIQLALKLVF